MAKKKVMLFFPQINKIGGVESCLIQFCKRFKDTYDITIGYDVDSDEEKINEMKRYAKVEKQETLIKTDIFIQCSMWAVHGHLLETDKIILWVHCIPLIYPNSIIENKEFMSKVNSIVCVSKYCQKIIEDYGYEAKTIYNDFNIDEIREKSTAYKTKHYDYCYVGRLSTEKGIHKLQKLSRADRSKQIAVVGCPYEQTDLMDMILDQPNIDRIGSKENPFPYIKNSDFTVVPSDFESWGNTITESLIIGTPVIATDFDTAHEQIQDGVNGWIINHNMKELDKIKPLTMQPYDFKSNWEEWLDII